MYFITNDLISINNIFSLAGCNKFGPSGATYIANALLSNTSITDINLGIYFTEKLISINNIFALAGNNHFGPSDATEIANALLSNTSITDINLGIY